MKVYIMDYRKRKRETLSLGILSLRVLWFLIYGVNKNRLAVLG